MKWILIFWSGLQGSPTVEQLVTFEECKARALIHVENRALISPKAFCLGRDGRAVKIEPNK